MVNTYADNFSCSISNPSTSAAVDQMDSDANKIDCAAINQRYSCAKVNKKNPEWRKRILLTLDELDQAYKKSSDGNIPMVKKSGDFFTDMRSALGDNGSIAARFSSVVPARSSSSGKNTYNDVGRGSQLYIKSALHDFLKESNSLDQFDKLKEQVADEYIEFQNQFLCEKGVGVVEKKRHRNIGYETMENLGIKRCYASKEEAKAALDKNKSEIEKYYTDHYSKESALKYHASCSEKYSFYNWNQKIQMEDSCSAKFTQYFPDNKWDINSEELKKDPAYDKFVNCVKGKGGNPTSITITASASALNNSVSKTDIDKLKSEIDFEEIPQGLACKKGFLALSEMRARTAKDFLLSEDLFSEEFKKKLAEKNKEKAQINLRFRGSNGNGTSGDCPYEIVDGKEKLKKGYEKGGEKRKTLSDDKYVTVTANFGPKVKSVKEGPTCYSITKSCVTLEYKCREWKYTQRNWPRVKRD